MTSPVWLPAVLACSLWIRAMSSGPVLFRQIRIGEGGRPFTMLKFRTMRHQSDTQLHDSYVCDLLRRGQPLTKMDNSDTRFIRGGRVLRATGLDELPQLWNVVRGQMSIVGPRPCTPAEFELYQPVDRKRLRGPGGITGSWQVNGKNTTTFKRMVALDVLYLRNYSFTQDIGILAKTVPTLVKQAFELLAAEDKRKISIKRWGRRPALITIMRAARASAVNTRNWVQRAMLRKNNA